MICPHRGIEFEGATCPYHGLSNPPPKGCFRKDEPVVEAFDESCLDRFDEQLGRSFFSYQMDVEAPRSLWMQNTADWLHLKTVHGDGFAKQFSDEAPYDVQISHDSERSSHKLKVAPDVVKSLSRIVGEELPPYFFHALLYPGMSITSFLGVFFSVEIINPTSQTSCNVATRFYLGLDKRVPERLLDAARIGNEKILLEDKALCERWAKTYDRVRHNLFLPGEERIRAYLKCEAR